MPWTAVVAAKVALNSALVLLPLVDLIYELVARTDGVFYLAACARLAAAAAALLLLLYCKRRGVNAADALFYYWLADSVCLAITFR